MILLQNAVHPIEELRKVKITADTNALVTGSAMSYSQYFTLLESAAANYDRAHSSTTSKQRQIGNHEFFIDHDAPNFDAEYLDIYEGTPDGGIDMDASVLFNVHQAHTQRPSFSKPSKF